MTDPIKIVFVLDQSGSMAPLRNSTIESFDGFVANQKQLEGEATLSLYKFSNTVNTGITYNVKNVKSLSEMGYHPNGGTALFDAIGKAISLEVTTGSSGILVILTDGEENASTFYNKAQISKMISDIQELNGWEVIFMGANISNFKEFTHDIGVKASKSFMMNCTAAGMHDAYASISSETVSYRATKLAEAKAMLSNA